MSLVESPHVSTNYSYSTSNSISNSSGQIAASPRSISTSSTSSGISSSSQSSTSPSPNSNSPLSHTASFPSNTVLPSYPQSKDWNEHLPHIYAGSRKGAKSYQEDSFCAYISPSGLTYMGGVFDGHGGYNGLIASSTARDYCHDYFHRHRNVMDDWTVEEWQTQLVRLFTLFHQAIRHRFLHETEPSPSSPTNHNSNTSSSNSSPSLSGRYVDDKGIVRHANGDPIHGGSTATVVVMKKYRDNPRRASIITVNVGDSTALLLPHPKGKYEFISVDHGPENNDEYKRIHTLDTNVHPLKLLFVYDKTNTYRKYECPLVFKSDGSKDQLYISNPWGHGLHPTNVRYEPAVYAVTPKSVSKDSTCIAMTRALGDFYAHQFGLTCVPSITCKNVSINDDSYTLILASDGIWDCWKYEDFHHYLHQLFHTRNLSLGEGGEMALDESMDRAIQNFGTKHYDDACLVVWQFKYQ